MIFVVVLLSGAEFPGKNQVNQQQQSAKYKF